MPSTANDEFGAVQKRVDLADREKMLQNEPMIVKFGFDIAENGPSKVSVTNTYPRPRYSGSYQYLYRYRLLCPAEKRQVICDTIPYLINIISRTSHKSCCTASETARSSDGKADPQLVFLKSQTVKTRLQNSVYPD